MRISNPFKGLSAGKPSEPARHKKLTVASFGAGCVLIGTALSTQVLADPNHGEVPEGGRFTPNRAGAEFPPQPRSATNVRFYTPRASLRARSVDRSMATILADENVTDLLGERYALLRRATHKDKWSGTNARDEIVFFSHTWNQTVRVTYQNNQISDIKAIAASEDQPALGESEKAEAIELARMYWVNQGSNIIDELTGYAIQTFRDDGSPYATRMTYVSFHTESPEPPLLINWVDLTTQQVVRSEVER